MLPSAAIAVMASDSFEPCIHYVYNCRTWIWNLASAVTVNSKLNGGVQLRILWLLSAHDAKLVFYNHCTPLVPCEF
jgi:hypothetical protein